MTKGTKPGEANLWAVHTAGLLAKLSPTQRRELEAIVHLGKVPMSLLGSHTQPDTGSSHEPSLEMIESITRALLSAYKWPGPRKGSAWPQSGFREEIRGGARLWNHVDENWTPNVSIGILKYDLSHDKRPGSNVFRRYLLRNLVLIAELREALHNNCNESALLRSISIGILISTIGNLLLHGSEMARSAMISLGIQEAHIARRGNLVEKFIHRDAEIRRLAAEISIPISERGRSKLVEPKINKWIDKYNDDLSKDEHRRLHEKPFAHIHFDRISRILAGRK